MPVTGRPRFDTLVLGELQANFWQGTPVLKGKAAFANSATGQTHGFTHCEKWSKETVTLLEQLRASMENDLSARDFEATTDAAGAAQLSFTGLGEHLAGGESSPL